jgi:replication factor C small subunit
MRELLAEKYRPKKIEDYIFQNPKIKKTVMSWVKEKSIPNVMMVGSQGLGKTTLARLLKEELGVTDADFKVMACSADTGIAAIREELAPWMKKAPLGKFKIVHLEEMDRLSKHAFDALKQLTEEFSDYIRFIATANTISRIPAPLMSRFTMLDLNGINVDDVINRVIEILDKEEIFPLDDNPDFIMAHIDLYYPDFRKILNSIEQSSPFDDNGNGFRTLYAPMGETKASEDLDRWEQLCSKDSVDPVELLELTHLVDDANYDWFYTQLYQNHQLYSDPAMAIIKIAKYLDMGTRTANQQIILDACIYELFFMEE